jgi:hypothetical protein
MQRIACFLFTAIIISVLPACEPPAYLLKATATPTITATYTPEPTPTYTPTPQLSNLEGIVFSDKNATGLQDEATYMPCLNQRCDLVNEMEPGLPGFEVCVDIEEQDYCALTGEDGSFTLPLPARDGETVMLNIAKDPNEGVKEKEMRYINKSIGEIVIPAYTLKGMIGWKMIKKGDVTHFEEGLLNPDIFYQGEVAEQKLNGAELIKIADGIGVIVGKDNPIGLMNERITYPFRAEDWAKMTMNGGYDHDSAPEKVIDFTGEATICWDLYDCEPKPSGSFSPFVGVKDGHSGNDFGAGNARGIPLYAVRDGIVITSIMENGAMRTYLYPIGFGISGNSLNDIGFAYGHLDSVVVPQFKEEYTGQLIGFIGSSGTDSNYPHLHLETNFGKEFPNIPLLGSNQYAKDLYAMMDPMYIIKDFNDISSWTAWNQPVFFPISYAK